MTLAEGEPISGSG